MLLYHFSTQLNQRVKNGALLEKETNQCVREDAYLSHLFQPYQHLRSLHSRENPKFHLCCGSERSIATGPLRWNILNTSKDSYLHHLQWSGVDFSEPPERDKKHIISFLYFIDGMDMFLGSKAWWKCSSTLLFLGFPFVWASGKDGTGL